MRGIINMKIQLPNGKSHTLDEGITLEEKIQVTEDLTEEWMCLIGENWDSNSIRFFLDSLSNYLVWHKEADESGHDKEVMSRNKTNRLVRGRKDTLFSDLSKTDSSKLFGESEDNYNG
jgi:hypothetical protein